LSLVQSQPWIARAASRDAHRPIYHFMPPANWMNDPNGFIQWGTIYHLFYQHNPNEPVHANIHWGHAASEDLVHWRHLPIALAPTPGGPDAEGCWSGCAVNDNGTPTIIYSGASPRGQRACVATSSDGLVTWKKYAENPVIPEPPAGLDLVAYRDHSVWREDDAWYQVIGAGLTSVGGAALLYRSHDLRCWQYLHPLCTADRYRSSGLWTGSMWECPDFFGLQDRHVLLASIWEAERLHYSAVLVGEYRDHYFTPDVAHKLDYGDSYFYAPQSLADNRGRRVVIGWVREGRPVSAQRAAGWSGSMSLPRELTLRPDGLLGVRPVDELKSLRYDHRALGAFAIVAGEVLPLDTISGDRLELQVDMVPGRGGSCGLLVRRSPDAEEETRIVYDAREGTLVVDRARSTLDQVVERTQHTAPLELANDELLQLRVFLDGSVLEVFANDRLSITTRIYPTRTDSLGIAVFAERQDSRLVRFDAWQMRSSWDADS
jgi:beta-fructofuranosidase